MTFYGHILPGSFFLIFGLHWTYFTIERYFIYLNRKRLSDNEQFLCTATFSNAYSTKVPVEALFKVLFIILFIINNF